MNEKNVAALLLNDETADAPPRALLKVEGERLIDIAIERAATWPVGEIVVVLGAHSDEILDKARLEGVTVILEPEWKVGIVSLLRVGLDWLLRTREYSSTIIAPSDLSAAGSDVVTELVEFPNDVDKHVVVPKYRYSWDWPILVDDPVWGRLMGMEDDMDIKQLLLAHPEWIEETWIDRLPPTRISGPQDLRAVRRRA